VNGRARVGLVVVVLAAGVAVGQATAVPAPAVPEPRQLPVRSTMAVCPDVRQEGDAGTTAVTAAGLPGGGQAVAGPAGQAPAPVPAGPVVRGLATDADGAFAVTATGEGAGGVVVEQVTRGTAGAQRGLAALVCPAPATSAWFVGGATVAGSSSELLLVNLEDVAAVVDVQVWTEEGPADPRPGQAVSVPPRGRLAVPLDRLAPDRELLALHVRTTRGRVAPALRVVRADGRIPLGTDWVPQGQPPADEVVVPGLPQGPGRRTVLLTNPTGRDAVAELELTTQDGQYVPEPLAALAVPAGRSVEVDLTAQLAGTGAAVRVRSDGPALLAGALVLDGADGPVRDLALTAAASGLSATALLADVRLSPSTQQTLLLSALDDDAVVDLVPVAAPGKPPEPQRVEVPAGTTVVVPLSRLLPAEAATSSSLEVRPVSGQVHAARYVRERSARGPLTTLLPLSPSVLTVPRPVVVPDPGAGR
jgi:hypothetical protein